MSDVVEWVVLAPLLLVLATAFVKFGVVLAILRRALGGGAVPPAGVTTVLALLFATFMCAPIADQVVAATAPLAKRPLGERVRAAAGPVRGFFEKHTPPAEQKAFAEMAAKLRGATTPAAEADVTTLAAAFCTAELKAAFRVGFFLFLPFLLLELLTALVLTGMGLRRLSPELVSLPLKLMLFVAVDGWQVLMRSLVLAWS